MTAVAQDFREMLRVQEIAEQLDAEVTALQQEFTRKHENLVLRRQQYGEASERIRAAGVVQDDRGHWTSLKVTPMASIAKRPDGQ
jgi:hypothetical protein